jgi:hypothetical protein
VFFLRVPRERPKIEAQIANMPTATDVAAAIATLLNPTTGRAGYPESTPLSGPQSVHKGTS